MTARAQRASNLVPRFLRMADAAIILGTEQLVKDCEKAGWLAPVRRGHRLTIFRFVDVHQCADRIDAGEWPGDSPKPASRKIKP